MKLRLAATDDLQALISLRLGYLRTDYTVRSPQQERQRSTFPGIWAGTASHILQRNRARLWPARFSFSRKSRQTRPFPRAKRER